MKKKKKVKPGPRGGTGGRGIHHTRYFDSEWHFIEAAAALIGLAPSTFTRRASLARAREILDAAGQLDSIPPPLPPEPEPEREGHAPPGTDPT